MVERPIRVLIVDDSAYMRKAIREMLEKSPRIQVVDAAWDGATALEKVAEVRPDVITIDLFMPGLGGIDFIRTQMERYPLPIVVCSSATEGGSSVLSAMEAGAVEFVQKPTALALETMYSIQTNLIRAVIAAAEVSFEKLSMVSLKLPERESVHVPALPNSSSGTQAILIGVSTGGPRALRSLLPRLPSNFPAAIAIALHMPPGYTGPLANRLNDISQIEVLESENGLLMKPGRAILARAGLHTCLRRREDGQVEVVLSQEPSDVLYYPSVDELFRTGSEIYGERLLGVVLTGMGSDGSEGSAWIKSRGGRVIAESESSSIVFGMPRSVIELGLADMVVDLEKVPEAIMEVL